MDLPNVCSSALRKHFCVVIFFCLGLKWTDTNSDCPPFGALASLSCSSSGSQDFLSCKLDNHSAPVLSLFIPSGERATEL